MRSASVILTFMLSVGLMGVASANPAPAAPAAPAAKPGKKAPSPDDMICTEEPITGSMFTKTTCLTRAQRAKLAEDGQKSIDDSRKINNMSQTKGAQ